MPARRLRGSSTRDGAHSEHVEMPRAVIDKEAIVGDIATVAIGHLRPHDVRETHLLPYPGATLRAGTGDWLMTIPLEVIRPGALER